MYDPHDRDEWLQRRPDPTDGELHLIGLLDRIAKLASDGIADRSEKDWYLTEILTITESV